jgi:PPOX class probable F420-dependent enzyme
VRSATRTASSRIGAAGFEPATSCSQSTRATRLRYAPSVGSVSGQYPAVVDLEAAREFLREHHRGVLATRRAGGGIQQTPVIATIDAEGRAIISSRETAYKVKNLRRDPWAQMCAFTDRFFGRWVYLEGSAEIVSLPEAMDLLIDYYKRFPGDNPDWDDYRARMERERRVLIRITLQQAGPDRQG